MNFFNKLTPVFLVIGTGFLMYGINEIIMRDKPRIRFYQSDEICELCGLYGESHIWYGLTVCKGSKKDSDDKISFKFEENSSIVLCTSCRNQSKSSLIWYSLQKDET